MHGTCTAHARHMHGRWGDVDGQVKMFGSQQFDCKALSMTSKLHCKTTLQNKIDILAICVVALTERGDSQPRR